MAPASQNKNILYPISHSTAALALYDKALQPLLASLLPVGLACRRMLGMRRNEKREQSHGSRHLFSSRVWQVTELAAETHYVLSRRMQWGGRGQ